MNTASLPWRSRLPSLRTVDRLTWYLVLGIFFVAPLPLGSNRPWAWSLLAAFGFIAFATHVMRPVMAASPGDRGQAWFTRSLLLLALFPLVQLVPMPHGFLDVLSPGSAEAWGLVLPDVMRPISVAPGYTLELALRQAGIVALVLAALYFFQWSGMRWRFVLFVVMVGLLNTILGLADYIGVFGGKVFTSTISSEAALTGTYVNKNHFAGLLLICVPLASALLLEVKRRLALRWSVLLASTTGLLLLAVLTVLVLALLVSFSRGAWLALGGGLLWVGILTLAGRHFRLLVALPILAGGGLLAFLVFLEPAPVSMASLSWLPYSAAERVVLWSDTLRAARDFWLFGSGLGTYDFVLPQFKSAELGYPRFDHAHNDYLEVLLTTGLAGLALVLAAIWTAFHAGLQSLNRVPKRHRSKMAFGASWAASASLFHALFDFNWQIPANQLYFLATLALFASVARSR